VSVSRKCGRQYVTLWQDNEKRHLELTLREREFGVQRLALERYRVHFLTRSSNPAAAEKQVERLTRRIAARFAAAQHESAEQREALADEAARLDERAGQLQQLQDDLDRRSLELAGQLTAWETRQLKQIIGEEQRKREVRRLQLLHENDERQLSALRDEIERIARLLLDDAADSTMSRAA